MWRSAYYKVFIGLIQACTLGLIAFAPARLNHDVSMYLEIGTKILNGQLPYVGYFEINLPMIHYLSSIPVALSQLFGINAVTMLMLLVWLLTLWSAWTSYRLLRQVFHDKNSILPHIIPLVLVMYGLLTLLWNEYGQREHLFILLFFPALLLRTLRWQDSVKLSRAEALSIGFVAAIGTAIKPYFAIIVIVIEVLPLLYYRRWKPLVTAETVGFFAFTALHMLYFLLFPQVLTGMIAVLQQVSAGYQAYGIIDLSEFFSLRLELIVLVLCLSAFVLPQQAQYKQLPRVLALFAVLAYAIVVIQRKDWMYHWVLFYAPAIMTLFYLIQYPMQLMKQRRELAREPYAPMILSLTTVFVLVIGQVYFFPVPESDLPPLLESYSDTGDNVLIISPFLHADRGYPTLRWHNRYQIASYPAAFPLLMGYADYAWNEITRPDIPIPPSVETYLQITADDIALYEPRLVMVEYSYLDVWTYLDMHGFIDDYITPQYQRVADSENYVIYQRQDS